MLIPGTALCVPYLYSFTGNVALVEDSVGLVEQSGLDVGSSTEYQFVVDLDRQGYIIDFGNYIYPEDSEFYDHYFTKVHSTPYLLSHTDDYNQIRYSSATYDGAYLASGLLSSYGLASIDSPYFGTSYGVSISLVGVAAEDWTIGQVFRGVEDFMSDSHEHSRIDSRLYLVSIEPAPVPEPSTLLLLASGLVGLGVYSRRKKS